MKGDADKIKELASFLEKRANVSVETIQNELVLVLRSDENISIDNIRALLEDFLQKANLRAKVKRIRGRKTLTILKNRGKPIFCGKNGLWKDELEQRLNNGDEIVLLALGDVKYELLSHLNKRKDIKILKLETSYMKKREKGLGLELIIKRKQTP